MRLLESQRMRERRSTGVVASLVAHAAIVAAAVAGTVNAGAAARVLDVPDEIIYRAPAPEPDRQVGPTTSHGTPHPGAPTDSRPLPDAPTIIPGELPPVDFGPVTGPAIDPTADALRRGGPGTGGGGGTGGTEAGPGGTWDAHAVEVPAMPDARNPVPSYPEPLRVAGVAGRVLVEFVVDTTGRVRPGSLAILEVTHELFVPAVRRNVPSLRFAPARVAGRPVAQRVRMPFEFDIVR